MLCGSTFGFAERKKHAKVHMYSNIETSEMKKKYIKIR